VAERNDGNSEQEQCEIEREAMAASHRCAVQLIVAHLHIATKGLMTYCETHDLISRAFTQCVSFSIQMGYTLSIS